MRYEILGYKVKNYTNKDGRLIDGVLFYLVECGEQSSADVGYAVLDQFFVRKSISGEPTLGAECELQFALINGTPRCTGIVIY